MSGRAQLASPCLERFFAPKSVAIVGASEDAYWSRNAYTNLPLIGFSGRVVPVNPKRKRVFGLDCIPTLRQLTTPVDLAYIAAPPTAIPAILEDAGAAGVRNAVVIAAGFGEFREAGHRLQRSLVDQARRHDITLLGPNCPGFLNLTDRAAAYGQQIPWACPGVRSL